MCAARCARALSSPLLNPLELSPPTQPQVTTDASAGAMASFLYSLDVGEVDFPELKRDQRCDAMLATQGDAMV